MKFKRYLSLVLVASLVLLLLASCGQPAESPPLPEPSETIVPDPSPIPPAALAYYLALSGGDEYDGDARVELLYQTDGENFTEPCSLTVGQIRAVAERDHWEFTAGYFEREGGFFYTGSSVAYTRLADSSPMAAHGDGTRSIALPGMAYCLLPEQPPSKMLLLAGSIQVYYGNSLDAAVQIDDRTNTVFERMSNNLWGVNGVMAFLLNGWDADGNRWQPELQQDGAWTRVLCPEHPANLLSLDELTMLMVAANGEVVAPKIKPELLPPPNGKPTNPPKPSEQKPKPPPVEIPDPSPTPPPDEGYAPPPSPYYEDPSDPAEADPTPDETIPDPDPSDPPNESTRPSPSPEEIPEGPLATAITIDYPVIGVDIGQTLKLTATVTPSNIPRAVFWSVQDESIATIDQDGNLTGVKAGYTRVFAKIDGQTAITEVFSGGYTF